MTEHMTKLNRDMIWRAIHNTLMMGQLIAEQRKWEADMIEQAVVGSLIQELEPLK